MAKRDIKEKLKKEVWSKKKYYEFARKGSLEVLHPGMKILKRISSKSNNILDMGCGEGTRLNYLIGKRKKGVGIDISKTAIKEAKKRYPNSSFYEADLENVPFKNNTFDLVFSAFVFEHLENPEKVILEAIRVTKKLGKVILIAPNYGSPNRSSPPNNSSRPAKLLKGFILDIERLAKKVDKLDWNKVTPLTERKKYKIDYDVVIEPYLGTLIDYFRGKCLTITRFDSCWSEELPGVKIQQKVFRYLGEIGIYPFKYWGPHFVIVAEKNNL